MKRLFARKIKLMCVILTLVLIVTMFIGVSVASAKRYRYTIGFAQCMMHAKWMAEFHDFVKAEAKRLNVKLIVANAAGNSSQQLSQVEDMITRKVDGLLLNVVDGAAIVPIIEEANRLGIPVVCSPRGYGGGEVVSFVTGDYLYEGVVSGSILAVKFDGKGKFVELIGPLGASPFRDRSNGFNSIIDLFPGMKVIATANCNANRSLAYNSMADILIAHPDIDGVYTGCSEMTLGAVEAIKDAGRQGGIMVVDCAGPREAMEAVQKGDFYCHVTSTLPWMGAHALKLLVDHLDGKEVPARVEFDTSIVLKSNVDSFLKNWDKLTAVHE